MRTLALAVVAFALTGCAAVLGSKEKSFDLQSTPQGADVFLDGNRLGATPVKVKLSNQTQHTFVFKKEGYKNATCSLAKGRCGLGDLRRSHRAGADRDRRGHQELEPDEGLELLGRPRADRRSERAVMTLVELTWLRHPERSEGGMPHILAPSLR